MDRPRLIAPILAIALGACAAHRPATPSVPMETALVQARDAGRVPPRESLGAGLQGLGTFGTGPPVVPVVVPPDIRRVWVPTHETPEGELVAGHWVFLRVTDFRWFLEPAPARGAGPGTRPLEPPPATPIPRAGTTPGSGVPWVETPPAASATGAGRPAAGRGTAPLPGPAGTGAPPPGR